MDGGDSIVDNQESHHASEEGAWRELGSLDWTGFQFFSKFEEQVS